MSDDSEHITEVRPLSNTLFVRLGLATIALTFGLLTMWSIAAPLESAVVAPAHIVVDGNRKLVQHPEGGVVKQIHVREGQLVEVGELLIQLDTTAARVDTDVIEGQLLVLYAKRSRLEAERDGTKIADQVRGIGSIVDNEKISTELANEEVLFNSRQSSLDTETSLLSQKIVQQNERINGLVSQTTSIRHQMTFYDEQVRNTRKLQGDGYASVTRLRELETSKRRLAGELGANQAAIAEASSIISGAKLEIERSHNNLRQEAMLELRTVEPQIAELEDRRRAVINRLAMTGIVSPAKGRVFNLTAHTIGGVIEPGAAILEIVPDDDQLVIAASVSPQDVDRVHTRQESTIRFSALGGRETPEVLGTVAHVGADSLVDQQTGMAFYTVKIEIPDRETLATQLNGQTVIPGMPVEALINTGSQPAISYLLRPLTDAVSRSFREE